MTLSSAYSEPRRARACATGRSLRRGFRVWGTLLYTGRDQLPLADERILAVPLSELWEQWGVSKEAVDWEKSLGVTQ